MPLTVPDQTIAAQVKVPDALTTLNGIMNFKSSKLKYEADAANLGEKTALRDLVNSPGVQNPDGSVNPDKYAAAAIKAAPTLGATTAQGALSNQTTSISNRAMQYKLTSEQGQKVQDMATGLFNNKYILGAADPNKMQDPEYASEMQHGILQSLSDTEDQMEQNGIPKLQIKAKMAPLYLMAQKDPTSMRGYFGNVIAQGMSAQGQATAAQPTLVNNGQQAVNVNPLAVQAPIQQQLPPSTPTMQGSTPGYLGPQPAQGGNEDATLDNPNRQGPQGLDLSEYTPAQIAYMKQTNPQMFANGVQDFQQTQGAQQPAPRNGFVPSGLPVGAGQGITGTQDQINKHWSDAQASSNTAQQDIGVLQNIKQHAVGAATGVGADKRAVADGILGMLGMDGKQMSKTDYDLLEKNSNMLALAGGDTNLAKTMAQVANPNAHMTKEAIMQAADQVIGQRKLALARAQFLTPFKAMADQGHPEMYNNAVNQFNSVADPRVIQFKEMTPEEKSNMKSAMTPQERIDFGAKLAKARSLGVAP